MPLSFCKAESWLLSCFALLAFSPLQALAQAAPLPQVQPVVMQSPASSAADSTAASYTLKVTTREVGVEVVALDEHQHPVRNLTQNDFQVFEVISQPGSKTLKHPPESLQLILGFQVIDSAATDQSSGASSGGFQGTSISTCATRATLHYRLSFRPSAQASTSGYHELRVTTTRPHVTLYYRRKYFVGTTSSYQKTDQEIGQQLQLTCSALSPASSIALAATPTPEIISQGNSLGYLLAVQANSLSSLPLPDGGTQFHLDYGICEYNSAGLLQGFFRAATQQSLTPPQYQHALMHGILSHLAIPIHGTPAMLRFIVIDAGNGNLGTTDALVSLPEPDITKQAPRHVKHASRRAKASAIPPAKPTNPRAPLLPQSADTNSDGSLEFKDLSIRHAVVMGADSLALLTNTGTFGSPIPLPAAMCGDVYLLPPATTAALPNFWNLYPLGELHPYSLDVSEELLTRGIWGRINLNWIGIDYYGNFWITKPGKYSFWLTSDDGARLYIDNRQRINVDGLHLPISGKKDVVLTAGSHALHLPYFQGPGTFALVLKIRSPGEKHYKIFDVRNFKAPKPTQIAGKK